MREFSKALADSLRQCPELEDCDLTILSTPTMQTELSLEFLLTGEISPDYLRRLLKTKKIVDSKEGE